MASQASSQADEWGTPQWLFDLLDDEFSFQLDVCASEENHKVPRYHDIEANGLVSPWAWVNFCNPPYSNQLPWIERAVEEVLLGNTTVMLLKHDPSTKHGVLANSMADEVRVVEHRLKFQGASNCANFPSSIAVFRPRLYTRKTDARILFVSFPKDVRID